MRLAVPFIAPRQLGAVGDQLGRQNLPSVEWCTGQQQYMSGARSPSILGAANRWASGPVGALDTVRCTPNSSVCPTDRWRGHASPADYAGDRWLGRLWLIGQSGAPPDSPVIFSRGTFSFSQERRVHRRCTWTRAQKAHWTVRWFLATSPRRFLRVPSWRRASLGHRTLSGAPPDSPVCQAGAGFGWLSQFYFSSFLLFLAFLALR
jgi:hypothetical protein